MTCLVPYPQGPEHGPTPRPQPWAVPSTQRSLSKAVALRGVCYQGFAAFSVCVGAASNGVTAEREPFSVLLFAS